MKLPETKKKSQKGDEVTMFSIYMCVRVYCLGKCVHIVTIVTSSMLAPI